MGKNELAGAVGSYCAVGLRILEGTVIGSARRNHDHERFSCESGQCTAEIEGK